MSHRYTPRNRTITLPLTLSQTDYEVLQGAGAQNDADIALALVGMIDEGFNRLAKPEPLWEGEPDPEPLPDDPFADEEEEPEPGNVMGYIRSFDTRLLIAELRRRGAAGHIDWGEGQAWVVLRLDNTGCFKHAAHFTDPRDFRQEVVRLAQQGVKFGSFALGKNGLYNRII